MRTRPQGQGQMIFVSSKCICSLSVGHNNFKLCRCIGHMMYRVLGIFYVILILCQRSDNVLFVIASPPKLLDI